MILDDEQARERAERILDQIASRTFVLADRAAAKFALKALLGSHEALRAALREIAALSLADFAHGWTAGSSPVEMLAQERGNIAFRAIAGGAGGASGTPVREEGQP